jgi:hypothetical protein
MKTDYSHRMMTGTTIVPVRTRTDIMVGIDSKVAFANKAIKAEPVCKITQVGRVFFASAKFAGNRAVGLVVSEFARQAVEGGGTIAHIIDRFEQTIKQPLYEYMRGFRQYDVTRYDSMFGNDSVLDVVFFGIEDEPIIAYRRFTPVFRSQEARFCMDGKDRIRVLESGVGFIMLGHVEPLIRFVTQRPNYWNELGLKHAIRNLIQLAIDDDPSLVGPPIVIVGINGKGARWVQGSKLCPAIQSYK